jgi:anthraniloyl-CoA monooxygenase
MKIACIGGGPASLYFALLLKKREPKIEIDVYEQNRADDTFGWGVVFSDETLGNFETADPESFARIQENFAYWTDIDTFYRGEKVTSTGHGFCGLARKRLDRKSVV